MSETQIDGVQIDAGTMSPIGGELLFTSIASQTFSSVISSFNTLGYATAGLGGGRMVNDSLATSSLATNCPRFCVADLSGRYWRLAGPTIYVEQGGATGSGNDQPAVQATLAYAAAVGIFDVQCQKEAYSLWCPIRATAWNTLAPDGHFLVITNDVTFSGCAAGTTFTQLNSAGGPYSTVTQTVSSLSWYGGAMFIWPGGTGSGTIGRLTVNRIRMTGGVSYTLSGSAPAGNSGPGQTGVNLSGKGFWAQSGTITALYFSDSEFDSVYGECCYLSPTSIGGITINNLRLHDSPQSTWNPSGWAVKADTLICYSSYLVEILGGPGQSYKNSAFYNLNQFACTGGPANGLLYNYAYPTRVSTTQPPWVDFWDCQWSNINLNDIQFGSYVRVNRGCQFTDCQFTFDAATTGGCGAFWDCYIDADFTIDQANFNPICVLQGPPTLTTVIPGATGSEYIQPPQNIHIRLSVHRSEVAIANGRYANVFNQAGYFDPTSCSLTLGGHGDGVLLFAYNAGYGTLYNQPLMRQEGPTNSHLIEAERWKAAYPAQMSAGPYTVVVNSPNVSLWNTGSSAAIVCSMPVTAGYFADGQICRVFFDSQTTSGTTYTFAQTGAGMKLNSACTLGADGDWLEVEWNPVTSLWHETARMV